MTTSTRRLAAAAAALLSLLVLAACGNNQVGGNLLQGFKDQTPSSDLGAVQGSPTPSATAAATSAPASTHAPVTAAPTSHPAPTPTPVHVASRFAVTINADASTSQFDPPVAQVPKGTIITWTNRDTVARSVVADDNSFNSGAIAPGASWSYTVTAVGQVSYHDGTRPYAVASLQVTAT